MRNNVQRWTSNTISYNSSCCHQRTAMSFSYSFHVPYTILSNVCYFCTVRSMFSFLFNRSQSEAGVVNQMRHLSFRGRSTIGQVNVQTTTDEKEKLYILSNSKVRLFLSEVQEMFLKCRQINCKIPVMDFTFWKIYRLKSVTLPKMCSFKSISKAFCSDFRLSLNISQHFRSLYFPECLLTRSF